MVYMFYAKYITAINILQKNYFMSKKIRFGHLGDTSFIIPLNFYVVTTTFLGYPLVRKMNPLPEESCNIIGDFPQAKSLRLHPLH